MSFEIEVSEIHNMEKKYFAERSKLMLPAVSLILLLFLIVYPFIFGVEMLWVIWLAVPFFIIGAGFIFKRMFYYPVFSEDTLLLKHALVKSWTRDFKYSDIHYAAVSELSKRDGTYLELSLEFLDETEPVSFGLFLTATSQMDELKAELASHGIPDMPERDVKKLSQIEFKSKTQIVFLSMSSITMVALSVVSFVWSDLPMLSILCICFCLPILLLINYVVLGTTYMEIKNVFLPFLNVRIFYSDIQMVSYNESTHFLKVVREDSAPGAGSKVSRRYLCCDGAQFYSRLKSILPPEKCS